MSRTKPRQVETQELRVLCTYCLAEPGEWCTSNGSRWSTFLHAARFYSAKAAGLFREMNS